MATCLLVRYDGREGGEGEVDPGVGHEVRLELLQVDVERPLEPERGRRRGDDLGHHPVQVGVGRPGQVQLAEADVVQGLVVHQEGHVVVVKLEGGKIRISYFSLPAF